MISNFTKHAELRAQQRGVTHQIANLLIQYGDEKYDGHGGVVRFFSNDAIREMRAEIGVSNVKKLAKHLRTYLVEASTDGSVITVGRLYPSKHIWRH